MDNFYNRMLGLISVLFCIICFCSCSALYDDLELCGLLGGTCRPQSSSCGRELRHRWGVSLCGRSTDMKCCADRTVTNTGTPSNACHRAGGTCQAWYQPCTGNNSSNLACDEPWHSCCLPHNTIASNTDYTGAVQRETSEGGSRTAGTLREPDTQDNPPVSSSIRSGQCGQQLRSNRQKRIIGGSLSPSGVWPWHVGIKTAMGGTNCAGTIINRKWIMTAAHCFKGMRELSYYRVVPGPPTQQSLTSYSIKRIIKHHLYEDHEHSSAESIVRHAHKYDIALIELEEDLEYTSKVQPVCLPEASDNFESKTCWLVGWGSTQSNGNNADMRLRHVRGQVMSKQQCQNVWGSLVDGRMICFGNDNKGACRGDSGGGLFCQNSSGYYTLAGIISWGSAQCNQRATVLTDISQYHDWINGYITSSSDNGSISNT